jgi:hypothetical protein
MPMRIWLRRMSCFFFCSSFSFLEAEEEEDEGDGL